MNGRTDFGSAGGGSGAGRGTAGVSRGRLQAWKRIELGDYPVDAAWSPDGRTLAVGLSGGALLWFTLEQAALSGPRRLPGHGGAVLALAWQKAGRLLASAGEDGTVLLWDARTQASHRIHQDGQWSERLAFADDGRWLAVATGRTLRLFDTHGELQHRYAAHWGTIAALAWRPKSAQIAAAGNGGVQLHQLPPQGTSQDYPVRGACLTAAFRPDGRVLAAGLQEGSVQLWYLVAGTQSQMAGYGARVFATEWSANGRYLATAAGTTLAVWDFGGKGPEGSQPLSYPAHSERISAIAFSPVGNWLVSAALDRRLLLWRVGGGSHGAADTAEVPHDAHLLAEECSLLRFSRDGARLAVGDAGGGLTIFDCRP